jgi:hypothetical protein
MVKNPAPMRCGPYFKEYTKRLKEHARVSDTELTDGLAKFLEEEQLTPLLVKRAQEAHRRRMRGVFR